VIVSIGVEKLNNTNNNDSPKKKKNIQNESNIYDVSLEVSAVNWYLCLYNLYQLPCPVLI
jgi:hypothetical protein